MNHTSHSLVIRKLGHKTYEPVWHDMQIFTMQRTHDSPDELWFVEHPPIFTLGLNAKQEHIINPGDIPVLHVDRGGQVTYHGPGQVVIYLLIDLQRRGMGVRHIVTHIEKSIVALLAKYNITAYARPGAPGVYVDEAKIAALGLRIKRGCSYHGLALNVAMDLEPFSRINPCGYPELAVTQVSDLGGPDDTQLVAEHLIQYFATDLSYNIVWN